MDSARNENENKKDERANEGLIPGSEMYPIDSCLYEVCRSICKIKTDIRKKIKINGRSITNIRSKSKSR